MKLEVQDLLESMCGVAEATMVDTVTLIFNFLHPVLVDCVTLLGKPIFNILPLNLQTVVT